MVRYFLNSYCHADTAIVVTEFDIHTMMLSGGGSFSEGVMKVAENKKT